MRLIGLLGGTFNPIHYGHLRMAQELVDTLNLDEIRFIPAANPPHKSIPLVHAEHRLAMVRLAIANNPLFRVDGRELARPGLSYTVDTLESLTEELGKNVSLVLLMGSDAFTKLPTWHRWERLIELCHIALVQRPHNHASMLKEPLPKILEQFLQEHYTENTADLQKTAAGLITMQHMTALDISSTAIRQMIAQADSVNYLMPHNVIEYIVTHRLYQANSER